MLLVPFGNAAPARDGLRFEVGEAAARLIEQASPAEHHEHGHVVGADDKVICGVHVFGTEPANPATVDEVSVVYGYYFCAMGSPGTPYLMSSRADGPVVVRFGPPPVVTIVRSGPNYAERVRALMPDEYEDQCFGGLPDDAVAARVKARYLEEVEG